MTNARARLRSSIVCACLAVVACTQETTIGFGLDEGSFELEIASGSPLTETSPRTNAYGGAITELTAFDHCSALAAAWIHCDIFEVCQHTCSRRRECPSVSGGSTEPRCKQDVCILPCGDGATCPDGMACIVGDTRGPMCMWRWPSPTAEQCANHGLQCPRPGCEP